MLCLNILCGITKLPDILLFREMRSTGECAKTSEGDGHGTEPWISVLTLCALTLKMEGENYENCGKVVSALQQNVIIHPISARG